MPTGINFKDPENIRQGDIASICAHIARRECNGTQVGFSFSTHVRELLGQTPGNFGSSSELVVKDNLSVVKDGLSVVKDDFSVRPSNLETTSSSLSTNLSIDAGHGSHLLIVEDVSSPIEATSEGFQATGNNLRGCEDTNDVDIMPVPVTDTGNHERKSPASIPDDSLSRLTYLKSLCGDERWVTALESLNDFSCSEVL
jgi:hypothetical protein